MLMLGGCAGSVPPSPAVTERPNLPSRPAQFGQPVPVPDPRKGQDARAFAAETRKSVLEANQRLRNDDLFYTDVERDFGAPAH